MAREEKPTTGMPVARESPFAAAIPTRSPVKDPGPRLTPMASSPPVVIPALRSTMSRLPMSDAELPASGLTSSSASSRPSSVTAMLFAVVDVSMTSSFTLSLLHYVADDIVVKCQDHQAQKQDQS